MEEHIRQSNLIEGITDPAEVGQSLFAFGWLMAQDKLTHGVICHVQKTVTKNQDDLYPHQRGYYRSLSKVNVRVGDHFPPAYYMVDGMMDNWLLDYEELGWWNAHVRFERIHPFVDGNGRTGRMLMWWQQLRAGDEPTLIRAEEKATYYESLRIDGLFDEHRQNIVLRAEVDLSPETLPSESSLGDDEGTLSKEDLS